MDFSAYTNESKSEGSKPYPPPVALVGLLVALLILSGGEIFFDRLAVLRLEKNPDRFSYKLVDFHFNLPLRRDPATIAFKFFHWGRAGLGGYLELTTGEAVLALQKEIKPILVELEAARERAEIRTKKGELALPPFVRVADQKLAPLSKSLAVPARDINELAGQSMLAVVNFSAVTILPTGQMAMVGKINNEVWVETASTVRRARLESRAAVEKGNEWLYQPAAIMSEGLFTAGRASLALLERSQKLTRGLDNNVTLVAAATGKLSVAALLLAETDFRLVVTLARQSVARIDHGITFWQIEIPRGLDLAGGHAKYLLEIASLADAAVFSSAEYGIASADAAAVRLDDILRRIWYGVPAATLDTLTYLKQRLTLFWDAVKTNWHEFIAGGEAKGYPLDEAALREKIRQEVLNELQDEFDLVFDRLRAGEPAIIQKPSVGRQGVVVVPEGKNPESPAMVRNRLEAMFSDPVDVHFDANGQSGVITPQFRDRAGDNYIFLLTPISE